MGIYSKILMILIGPNHLCYRGILVRGDLGPLEQENLGFPMILEFS